MMRIFPTIWKTLLIWPACCGFLSVVFTMVASIQKSTFTKYVSDPDLVLVPVFSYLMFLVPALIVGMMFCFVGVLKKSLPLWSVPISAVSAFFALFEYEASTRPYFQTGITKNTWYAIVAIFASIVCSYVVWRVVKKHWNDSPPS